MHEPELASLDDAILDAVMGGADAKSNIDTSSTGLSVKRLGEYFVPIPRARTGKTRTEFGRCADSGVEACEARDGGNSAVGDCSLNAIQACWDQKQQRTRSTD